MRDDVARPFCFNNSTNSTTSPSAPPPPHLYTLSISRVSNAGEFTSNHTNFYQKGGDRFLFPTGVSFSCRMRAILRLDYAAVTVLKAYRGENRRQVEESMLAAGRDKGCVEASSWDPYHERHASSILRHYRHMLYQEILGRLPFAEVTSPKIDWAERSRTVAAILAGKES